MAPVAGPANFAPPAAAIDPAAQEALTAALNDQRADSASETAFRQFVRLRLRSGSSGSGPIGDDVKQQVESTGPLAYTKANFSHSGTKALGVQREFGLDSEY